MKKLTGQQALASQVASDTSPMWAREVYNHMWAPLNRW